MNWEDWNVNGLTCSSVEVSHEVNEDKTILTAAHFLFCTLCCGRSHSYAHCVCSNSENTTNCIVKTSRLGMADTKHGMKCTCVQTLSLSCRPLKKNNFYLMFSQTFCIPCSDRVYNYMQSIFSIESIKNETWRRWRALELSNLNIHNSNSPTWITDNVVWMLNNITSRFCCFFFIPCTKLQPPVADDMLILRRTEIKCTLFSIYQRRVCRMYSQHAQALKADISDWIEWKCVSFRWKKNLFIEEFSHAIRRRMRRKKCGVFWFFLPT